MSELTQDLLKQFNAGSEAALETVFRHYHRSLKYYAGQFHFTDEEASELVAAVFADVHRQVLNGLRFGTFEQLHRRYFTLVRKAITDKGQHAESLGQLENSIAVLRAAKSTPEEDRNTLIEVNLLQTLYDAVEQLPDQYREVFKLTYLEEKGPAEIAYLTGHSIEQVKSIKYKAVLLLRKLVLNPPGAIVAGLTVGLLAMVGYYLWSFILPLFHH